jgi:tetratricopeptide (TPR) repeat protein
MSTSDFGIGLGNALSSKVIGKGFVPMIYTFFCLLLFSNICVEGQTGESVEDARTTQARQLIKQGKPDEAVKLLQDWEVKAPNDAPLKFWLGKVLYLQGKYQEAIGKLIVSLPKLEKTTADYKEAVQMLGLSHYVLGHLAESIPYFEQIVKWSPENNEINYALGISYIQTRQPAKSREVYARLFGVVANSAASYLLNAQMHVRQRFEETAEIELIQALKFDAKLPQANFVLGE